MNIPVNKIVFKYTPISHTVLQPLHFYWTVFMNEYVNHTNPEGLLVGFFCS